MSTCRRSASLRAHRCQTHRSRYRVVTDSRSGDRPGRRPTVPGPGRLTVAHGPCPVPRPRGSVVPRTLKLALFALVLLGLVGGSVAWFAAQKSLTLTVDGEAREVSTYTDTVGEVLEE